MAVNPIALCSFVKKALLFFLKPVDEYRPVF